MIYRSADAEEMERLYKKCEANLTEQFRIYGSVAYHLFNDTYMNPKIVRHYSIDKALIEIRKIVFDQSKDIFMYGWCCK